MREAATRPLRSHRVFYGSRYPPVRLAEEELPEGETYGLTLLGWGADTTSTMSLQDHVHDAMACARSRGRYPLCCKGCARIIDYA